MASPSSAIIGLVLSSKEWCVKIAGTSKIGFHVQSSFVAASYALLSLSKFVVTQLQLQAKVYEDENNMEKAFFLYIKYTT